MSRLFKRALKKPACWRARPMHGLTDRQMLIGLLARNTRHQKIRVPLRPSKSSPTQPAVRLRFQGYPKLLVLSGGGATGAPIWKETKSPASCWWGLLVWGVKTKG
ncbi:hypothetical protein [Hymenobacter elongatus]|uniref:Uncharacterized protein n=1 Tax=Hymenobacter elongatus TaxID=877208 RepID=A0A4Z0PJQ0_9BACT|nr:hypothetical protein [Hymenobacter elongatus]TGE15583.1 hypothetical protein E5J99_12350 [Hymenobacter elongatus]